MKVEYFFTLRLSFSSSAEQRNQSSLRNRNQNLGRVRPPVGTQSRDPVGVELLGQERVLRLGQEVLQGVRHLLQALLVLPQLHVAGVSGELLQELGRPLRVPLPLVDPLLAQAWLGGERWRSEAELRLQHPPLGGAVPGDRSSSSFSLSHRTE